MKIAYLTNQYPKTSHSFIRREIHALESLGFEVERYSIRDSGETLVHEEDVAEAARTRVILRGGLVALFAALIATALTQPVAWCRALCLASAMSWNSERGWLRHMAYLAEACVLLRWMRARSVEHLHVHFGSNPPTVAVLARALGGPPFSFTVHGMDGDSPQTLSMDRKIDAARFVVAVSYHGLSQLSRSCSLEQAAKIQLVRCGIDDAFLRSTPVRVPEAPRLVCVARFSKEKGHLILLQAVHELVRQGVRCELVLIGDGAGRPGIEATIERLGLRDHVQLRGWMDADDVKSELLDARALVLPSFSEGLPVAIMEAFALERPVISTYIAGIPELVVPRENGWLVPAGAQGELVVAMREALTASPDELQSMGRRGARKVAVQHDALAEARKLARLFREGPPAPREPRSAVPAPLARVA
jgi:glycosyltransferase involved in cell wall biosynthesis